MSVPEKHHYVPQFLLRRFADSNKKLLVYSADKDERPRWAPVRKVAQTLRGHTLYWPGREPDHTILEASMGSIETATGKVLASLLSSYVRTLSDEAREVLGFFIALQWYRSRFMIEILERSVLDPGASIDELALSLGIRQIQTGVLWPWQARLAGEFDPKERHCYIADWLQYGPWSWHLYRPTGPKLVVGDTTVCMWGVAAGATSELPERWTHHGMGVGFSNCARITVPLAPNLGLIIVRNDRPDLRKVDAAAFNRATIFNSREFVAHHTGGLPDPALHRSLLEDLCLQRQILPVVRDAARSGADMEREASLRADHLGGFLGSRNESNPFQPYRSAGSGLKPAFTPPSSVQPPSPS